MHSKYLASLNETVKEDLFKKLLESQNGKCFICGKEIDVDLHRNNWEIDHIEPLSVGGKDDPINFAITHLSCNRAKQASDLRVARVLSIFEIIKEKYNNRGPNHPNLGDVLQEFNGSKYEIHIKISESNIEYTLPEVGRNQIYRVPLFSDELSGLEYFFIKLPIEYLFHDDRINPRAIGGNLNKLVEEFFKKRPQLHISLA